MTKPLFNIYDLETARQGILRRTTFDDMSVSDSVVAGIERVFGEPASPTEVVRRIVRSVRDEGDDALLSWTEIIDGIQLESLRVPDADLEASVAQVPIEVIAALEAAAKRVTAFYENQPAASWMDTNSDGTLGQLIRPLSRVGVYVPGGTAPLPSSLLMSAIPARVAGVQDIIVCTPPGPDGKAPPVILAAAHIAGVKDVYRIGGAQAIAAMAYGTETIPAVDKIVGPGNLFVMLAKREVFGVTGIDGLLGPTETMIIADEAANPKLIAADLLAQAEHDVLAQAILVTPSRKIAEQVAAEIERQSNQLERSAQFGESLPARGGAVIVPDLMMAIEVANAYAPEHLQLCIPEPETWLDQVQHAGAVFVGEHSYEVLGDYIAGPSHSLPTGGTARFSSGNNLWDFVKVTAVIGLKPEAASRLGHTAETLARAECLDGHAAAVTIRRSSND